jgi:hypothetical protein
MSINVTDVRIDQFDNMVKAEYASKGFLLNNTTQVRRDVVGERIRFQKVGQGTAQRKPSQDDVPLMNPDYTPVYATLEEWVAADLSDIFDQQQINFDELATLAKVAGMAIGRRADQIIIDVMNASGATSVPVGSTNFTYEKFLDLNEILNASGVPVGAGNRFIAISASAEKSLLKDDEFTRNNYVNNNVLNGTGLGGQIIMGYKFIVIPDMLEGGLPKVGNDRTCFAWHEFSSGLGIGKDFKTRVDWRAEKLSNQVASIYKAGGVAIDDKGIVKIVVDETK